MKELTFETARPMKRTPMVTYLTGDEGEMIVGEVDDLIDSDFGGNPNLKVVRYNKSKKIAEGSNPLVKPLFGKVAKKYGWKLLESEDYERCIQNNQKDSAIGLDLTGTYHDIAFVFYNRKEPNSYLANKLAREISAAVRPLMIPLTAVDIVPDEKSPYGVSFTIIDKAGIRHAPQLHSKNNVRNFSKTKKGLPVFDENGDRTLFTGSNGLSGLCSYGYLGLGSYWDDLADSGSDGRVELKKY